MANDTGRTLIYASRKHDDAVLAYMSAQGWHVTPAKSASDVGRVLTPGLTTAALIDLSSGYSDRDMSSFETCMQPATVGWVAATLPQQLASTPVRRLIRDYCFDYVNMPCSNDALAHSIGHAWGMASLSEAPLVIPQTTTGDQEMVGTCEVMQQLFRTIRKVANTDAPVFISGESGTGKELTAVAIHERSLRAKGPFVAINCGAIPPHLMQSELFGYERGAFTGANQRKIGRVEAANGGTLFLDEIGDLPIESQAGLLRFLQQGAIERLGGHEVIPVNVRIISATHVDLEAAVKEGRFRTDLFHRLCVLRVEEPPLRARGQDIEILAHHVLQRFKVDNHRKIRGFTQCAVQAMYEYHWPGNVRELINRVRRAIVMADSRMISAKDLDLLAWAPKLVRTLEEIRTEAERQAIEQALLRHCHRLTDVAAELGISRITLYRLMCRYGLRGEESGVPA
ncbi:Fis family transcriptional regulator [Pandoraea terrae]|uniref:Fis family transcriptional regulator n=1 Tax=Pandoraea terrae TaxID=1537710 RepID=A0A5E4UHC2_9BURK|nr:sigma-54 dependent transcriptional regulator [Pandoraea terrae]VVD98912.1 Fis family transcriptional regulator [Pandoraea terrae]